MWAILGKIDQGLRANILQCGSSKPEKKYMTQNQYHGNGLYAKS